ncbi:MAG TPA: hypothetical protein VIJ34_07125 [Acidimicrobiales bacterium]
MVSLGLFAFAEANEFNGDDPLYVASMIAWMKDSANHVAYGSYFDYNSLPTGSGIDAKITNGLFPDS